MFSKSESKKLREDFWISFGKSYPKKWILYNTKIKDFSFKFYFDTSKAMVALDIESKDLEKRINLWEKVISLKSVLIADYLLRRIYLFRKPDRNFQNLCTFRSGKYSQ